MQPASRRLTLSPRHRRAAPTRRGAAGAQAGTWASIPRGFWKTVAFILGSPLLGFLLGSLLMLAVSWLFVRSTPSRVDRWFRRLQLVSASLYSLGHGGNDAQTTAGIIRMLPIAAGYMKTSDPFPLGVAVRSYHPVSTGPIFRGAPTGSLEALAAIGGAWRGPVSAPVGGAGVPEFESRRSDQKSQRNQHLPPMQNSLEI